VPNGAIELNEQHAGQFTTGAPVALHLELDLDSQRVLLSVDEDSPVTQLPAFGAATDVSRLTFRTGSYRNLGGKHPVAPGTDRPTEKIAFKLHACVVRS
jgi:hypothetical protein